MLGSVALSIPITFAMIRDTSQSLKSDGKAAIILPHGVLFRGNTEADIRKRIIDRGYIKGLIGLPANLFYGTGIPACILVIDKEDAAERTGMKQPSIVAVLLRRHP